LNTETKFLMFFFPRPKTINLSRADDREKMIL